MRAGPAAFDDRVAALAWPGNRSSVEGDVGVRPPGLPVLPEPVRELGEPAGIDALESIEAVEAEPLPEELRREPARLGAAGGQGEAPAVAAERGARVVLAARNAQDLETVTNEICARGGSAISVPTDVSPVALPFMPARPFALVSAVALIVTPLKAL